MTIYNIYSFLFIIVYIVYIIFFFAYIVSWYMPKQSSEINRTNYFDK